MSTTTRGAEGTGWLLLACNGKVYAVVSWVAQPVEYVHVLLSYVSVGVDVHDPMIAAAHLTPVTVTITVDIATMP